MFCIRILMLCFISISSIYGMAADEQFSSGESQAEQEDRFEYWDQLPQELQKKILWHAMEDAVPEHAVTSERIRRYGSLFSVSSSGDKFACMGADKKGYKVLRVYNMDNGKEEWTASGYAMSWGAELACSDSRVAVFSSNDNKIRIYDIHTGKKIGKGIKVPSPGYNGYEGQWDFKSERLACVSRRMKNRLLICDFDTRSVSQIMPEKQVVDISWSASGNQLAVNFPEQSSQISICKADTGKKVRTVKMPVRVNAFTWISVRNQMLLDAVGSYEDECFKRPQDYLWICDAHTGELQYRILKLSSDYSAPIWNFSCPTGNKVCFSSLSGTAYEIDFDVKKYWKELCDQNSFVCKIKKKMLQRTRWEKMRDVAKRLISAHTHKEYDFKKIHPLYVAALVSRLTEAKRTCKVALSAQEQMIFASLPKELQKRFKAGIRLKDGFKIPWGESLYGNDPVAEDCIVELDDTDSDAASEEQVGDKQEASDSDA